MSKVSGGFAHRFRDGRCVRLSEVTEEGELTVTIGLSFKLRVVTVGLALERVYQRNDKVLLLYDGTGSMVLCCRVVL